MNKHGNFGQNLVVLGQKILIFIGEIRSFVTHKTKNPPRHLVVIGFWSPWDEMGKNMPIFGQIDLNCIFWTNFGRFWAKNPNFSGVSKSFGTHIMEKPPRQLVCIVFWSAIRSNGPKMRIFGPKCQFWAKFGRFWAKNPIFGGEGVKILVPSYRKSNENY